MSVYAIIEITIKDKDTYFNYVDRVRAIVEKYKGRYLIRGGKVTPFLGNWHPERIILIEFPSSEDFAKCFGSQEYKEIAPLRECSTISRSVLVEGL